MKELFINTEYIKLDQALKFSAVSDSGAAAKAVILEGLVKENGEVCLLRGKKLRENDIFSFNSQEFIIKKG